MSFLIISINVVMVLLVIGIGGGIMPAKSFSGAVVVLHKIVGITLPTPEKERIVAVIWIASALIIADGTLFLMVLLTRSVFKG